MWLATLARPISRPSYAHMYISRKQSGCVRNCKVGGWRARHWPFWHHFACKMQKGAHPFGRKMVHLQTCSDPATFQNLSCSCFMIWCCKVIFGGGGWEGAFRGWPYRNRTWVKTQEMENSATSVCFQAGPSLRFAGGKEVSNEPELMPIEGEGGKRWAKMFPNICLLWVRSSVTELPAPKFTKDMRGILAHLQAFQAQSLGLCVGNSVHSSSLTCLFSIIAFHSPPLFLPHVHHHNQKNISNQMVCSGQEMVEWLQSYALRGLFGHVCLRKGWPSGGDDPQRKPTYTILIDGDHP